MANENNAAAPVKALSKPILTEDPEVRKKIFWGAGLLAFAFGVVYHITHKSKSYVKGHGDGFARGYKAAGGIDNYALPAPAHHGRDLHQLTQASEMHHDRDEE